MKKQKPKILLLLSGGLDSRVAATLLKEQADVECVFFILPFGSGCCTNKHCVFNFTQKQLLKLHIIDYTKGKKLQDYLNLIKKPKFSRGTALNPCIDCHIFMLKQARKLAKKLNIEIIATGEVLGERPLSQNKKALSIIEKEAKLEGKLLRPLSAKLLEETVAEKKGVIDRDKLLDIQGRKRNRQMQLAKKYKIDFPSPGGGCLLCEPEFCKKLKPILNKKSKITEQDIELIKIGRHFENSEIILGKNQNENQELEKIFKKYKKENKNSFLIIPKQPGPTAYVKNKGLIKQAKELMQKYSKHEIQDFAIQ